MTNIKLTYEYTLDSIKVVNDSINRNRATFTLIITLGGVLANFGKDLPGYEETINCKELIINYPCPACYLLKVIAYIFLITAIGISLRGLTPSVGGKIILPAQLISKEWNEADEEDCLYSLVEYLERETLLVLNELREDLATRLRWAITFVGIAVILFGLDEMLGSSLSVFGNYC